jgi:thymidylate synthase ThyX
MGYSCKILADSTASGVRLTTMEVTFPRIVLAEFNTHRVFSRNSASSRAIPVEKQIEKVMSDPFIPVYWGKNQKGMQAEEELGEWEQTDATRLWLEARDRAVIDAKDILALGVHKQITNRLLEPFMWQTCLVSATEWENFFALRCHRDAQPEIREVALMMMDAYNEHVPEEKSPYSWHLPLCEDRDELEGNGFDPVRVSAGRCARVSYLTHDGVRDPAQDVALCDRLVKSGHMSPMEHQAFVGSDAHGNWWNTKFSGNFRRPWLQFRKTIANEEVFRG